MSKERLIDAMTGLGPTQYPNRIDAEAAIEKVIAGIQRTVRQGGETVMLRGFGTFRMVDRKGKIGRNPRTGEPINIAARRQFSFKPAS